MKAKQIQSKIYCATVKGTQTQVKAFKKCNAVAYLQKIDNTVQESDVYLLKVWNSHQVVIELEYPDLYK